MEKVSNIAPLWRATFVYARNYFSGYVYRETIPKFNPPPVISRELLIFLCVCVAWLIPSTPCSIVEQISLHFSGGEG